MKIAEIKNIVVAVVLRGTVGGGEAVENIIIGLAMAVVKKVDLMRILKIETVVVGKKRKK